MSLLPCSVWQLLTKGQNHKKMLKMPIRPYISDKGQDLLRRLICEKQTRLCSRRYQMIDRGQIGTRQMEHICPYVFPDDAEDIKSHRWFKNVPWDQLHTMTPPFIPQLHGPDDTRYFEEAGSIDDMSDSESTGVPSPEKVRSVLQDFRPGFQDLAYQLVAEPYDTVKLRGLQRRIQSAPRTTSLEKDLLKHFVELYGHKERKRPRDRILRDKAAKAVAMDVRKRTAFMGYTWRRMRPEGYLAIA